MLLAAAPIVAKPVPWKTGDVPPTINGVKLGDTEQHALDLLGLPDDVNSTWRWRVAGIHAKGLE